MPLILNTQPETERPQLLVYDPEIPEDLTMVAKKRDELLAIGFTVAWERLGEIRMDPPPLPDGVGLMRIMSQNGDDRITWDTKFPKQVKEAGNKFKELVKKGYKACVPQSDGKPGHEIKEFDPALGEVIMVPQTSPG